MKEENDLTFVFRDES